MNLKRLYAVDGAALLAIGVGFTLWGMMSTAWWGGRAPGPVANDVYWRTAVFIRMFGAALAAFALAALAVWRSPEPLVHRAACPYFFWAHSLLLGIALAQQQAIWGTTAGAMLVNLFVLLLGAFGYLWLEGMRQPGLRRGRTLGDMRGEWENRIRETAGQQERNRLARDLHDSIKQQIYAIQTLLAAAQAQGESSGQPIELARNAARAAMAEMNALLDQLRPAPLETVGLVEALRQQAEAVGHRTGAQVNVAVGELPPPERLSAGTQTEVFRIAQEALSNVARHARARNVTLQLGAAPPGHLSLSIRDDGQGFQPGEAGAGMGLRNMRTRAATLGGTLEVESSPGAGASVSLRLPLEAPAVEEYCRHMRVGGALCAFLFGLTGYGIRTRDLSYLLPAALAGAAAAYHFREYAKWKRIARGAQA